MMFITYEAVPTAFYWGNRRSGARDGVSRRWFGTPRQVIICRA
jgi:hypothetical protein